MLKVAIVGRPNVGKSLLFNKILKKRVAIVHEKEGVTRDRLYSIAEYNDYKYILIDTGGIDLFSNISFNESIKIQSQIAIDEADIIIFTVDVKIGMTKLDAEIAKKLLKSKKKVILAVNKVDSQKQENDAFEFQALGIEKIINISALQNLNIEALLDVVFDKEKLSQENEQINMENVSIIGRANVGKSTLLNSILDKKRSITSKLAGTTRDNIDVQMKINNKHYNFIDTAGIRRKNKEKDVIEKFAFIRSKEAIERSDICLLLVDAEEGLTFHDKKILKLIEENNKSVIIILNKWDLVKNVRMEHYVKSLKNELHHFPVIAVSAINKRNINKIFPLIEDIIEKQKQKFQTSQLNKFFEKCIQKYHPPMIRGKRLRIYYTAQISDNPLKFIMFVNYKDLFSRTYKKYLINQFKMFFKLEGVPIVFNIKTKPQR